MTPVTFALDRAWRVDSRVSMRPEPFGALLYHFGTRRLSFLKSPALRTAGGDGTGITILDGGRLSLRQQEGIER